MYDRAIVIVYLILGTEQHRKCIFFKQGKSAKKNKQTRVSLIRRTNLSVTRHCQHQGTSHLRTSIGVIREEEKRPSKGTKRLNPSH